MILLTMIQRLGDGGVNNGHRALCMHACIELWTWNEWS